MQRIAFNNPLMLGFEEIERRLERTAKTDGYPPYNIEHLGECDLKITLAVAGFAPDELAVTVEDNQLVIRGRQNEVPDRTFLHRGIASRQFQKAFVLAEGLEVLDAELDHGLLAILLRRKPPQASVRNIAIRSGGVHTIAAKVLHES